MTARYDQQLEYWAFECDGIEFHLKGIPFNEAAFDWARQSAEVIRALEKDMRARVAECLKDWPGDRTKAEILGVELDEYPEARTILVAFTGDDSWGDFGVDVTITDGKIVDVSGGG
jgi:hypothetical protein